MKPGNAPLKSIRLLDQVRERIRYLHYSLSTEKVYVHWVKKFIFQNCNLLGCTGRAFLQKTGEIGL